MKVTTKPQSSPSLSIKSRIAISLFSFFIDSCERSDGTVNRRLNSLISKPLNCPANPKPVNGVRTYDVTVDPSRDLWFRVFVPVTEHPTSGKLPVLVFFHGGGFVYLAPHAKMYDDICRHFAREIPAIVVSVNYRLAPEHHYPAQYVDGIDVLKFLDNNHEILPENADLSGCFLAGDSAGGNIAHHVAVKACQSKFEQLKVIGLLAIQPFFGGEERSETEKKMTSPVFLTLERTDRFWRALSPPSENWTRDHEVINVSGPNAADISSLEFPATLVFVSGFDVLQDWQRKYYQWLKMHGKEAYLVEYPNMIHGFLFSLELPESGQLVSEVRDFVNKRKVKFPKT